MLETAANFTLGSFLFALAVIQGSKPPDEMEAMQVAQMAAVHEA